MNNFKRIVEVFTAGCQVCEPLVDMVKSLSCDSCKVVVYDISNPYDSKECLNKVKEYDIKSLPAVVVNGKVLDSGVQKEVTLDELKSAGIGQN